MKLRIVTLALACAVVALAPAQAPPPRVVVLNLSDLAVDIRLGTDPDATLKIDAVLPRQVTPLIGCRAAGEFALFHRDRGAAEWIATQQRMGEGEEPRTRLFALAPAGVYAVVVSRYEGPAAVSLEELAVPVGNRPKVLFTTTTMGPPRTAIVAKTKDAPDALTVEEITQYGVSGLHELPAAGPRSVFFQFPAFFDSLTHFLPDAKDPTRPAVFDFRDGGVYAVVLDGFTEQGASAWLATVSTGAPAAAPPRPVAPAALTGVPASWNGDWMVEIRPGRRALAIHDGKIFLVSGTMETETFPGTVSRQYSFTYSEREVATLLSGKPYEKYALSPDGTKIVHTYEGRVTVYVRFVK